MEGKAEEKEEGRRKRRRRTREDRMVKTEGQRWITKTEMS